MAVNSMILYIDKDYWERNSKVFEGVSFEILKDPKTLDVALDDHIAEDEDGHEYKRLIVQRKNHFDFSNCTGIKFELDDGPYTSYTSKEVAKFISNYVDTMV